VAQLPSWLVQEHLDAGTLVQILPELSTIGLPINVAWLKSRQSLPKVAALVDVICARLSQQAAAKAG
jgi:DNA-binding transcriptional LysR family regulator